VIERIAGDRELLQELSNGALERAREYTWENYAVRLAAAAEWCGTTGGSDAPSEPLTRTSAVAG
ncbi:MAG: hypothetical protein AB7O26_14965, partial [Planctomycetaceae bacterium]